MPDQSPCSTQLCSECSRVPPRAEGALQYFDSAGRPVRLRRSVAPGLWFRSRLTLWRVPTRPARPRVAQHRRPQIVASPYPGFGSSDPEPFLPARFAWLPTVTDKRPPEFAFESDVQGLRSRFRSTSVLLWLQRFACLACCQVREEDRRKLPRAACREQP